MKALVDAFERHYFRFMPFLMRAFSIAGLTMFTMAAVAHLFSDEPFTWNWAITYAVALPLFGGIWLASKKVSQMEPRSK